MERLVQIKCLDENGMPRIDKHGEFAEAPLLHNSNKVLFKGGEIKLISEPQAEFLMKQAKRMGREGRLEIVSRHNQVRAAVVEIDGKEHVMILDEDGNEKERRIIPRGKVAKATPAKKKSEKAPGKSPSERIAALNESLA